MAGVIEVGRLCHDCLEALWRAYEVERERQAARVAAALRARTPKAAGKRAAARGRRKVGK